MMSFPAWLALLVFYIVYLLIGGFTFRAIESPYDCKKHQEEKAGRVEILHNLGKLRRTLTPKQILLLNLIVAQINETHALFHHPTLEVAGSNDTNCPNDSLNWNFYNSLFFSFTAITTIGYGHLSPSTYLGKVVCILYSLLGVPINGILIGSLGAYFGNKLNKFKTTRPGGQNEFFRILLLATQILVYLLLGCIIFIVLPAIVFCVIEPDWDYLDSVYYAFVTLTTIGFGDYVAGRNGETLAELGNWVMVYQAGIIIWIIFGLGYVFLIIGVITDGLRAPAKRVRKKLAKAEKVVMTRVLQEIVLIKSKQDEDRRVAKGAGPSTSAARTGDVADNGSADNLSDISVPHAHRNSMPSGVALSVEELLEEMNQDTITSLRTFVDTAHVVRKVSQISSRRPTPPSRIVSHDQLELPSSHRVSDSFSEEDDSIAASSRPTSAHSVTSRTSELRGWMRRKLSFKSVQNDSTPTDEAVMNQLAASVSLPEILRETTMEEFLLAIERVKANTLIKEDDDDDDDNEEDKGTSSN